MNTSQILLKVKREPNHEILTASGQSLEGELYGDLKPKESNLDEIETLSTISNILEVPGISDYLISVDCLAERGSIACLMLALRI